MKRTGQLANDQVLNQIRDIHTKITTLNNDPSFIVWVKDYPDVVESLRQAQQLFYELRAGRVLDHAARKEAAERQE
jgi:hypothetical protein